MNKKIIAGIFASAIGVSGVVAQASSIEKSTEAANENGAVSEKKLSQEEKFAQNVLKDILILASPYALQKQEKEISAFCNAFNQHIAEPLKLIRNGIDISAVYKKDFLVDHAWIKLHPETYTDDACIVTVNKQKIDQYDFMSVLSRDEHSPNAYYLNGTWARTYAKKIIEALEDVQVRHIAREGEEILSARQGADSNEPALAF